MDALTPFVERVVHQEGQKKSPTPGAIEGSSAVSGDSISGAVGPAHRVGFPLKAP